MATHPELDAFALTRATDAARVEAGRLLDDDRRSELGQFLTPAPIARLMAGMFGRMPSRVRLLDAGAGVGSLTAAYVEEAARRNTRPRAIEATTFEIDTPLLTPLRATLRACERSAAARKIAFTGEVVSDDFITRASEMLAGGLYNKPRARFDAAILNPPYRKLNSRSVERVQLRSAGVETSNLYAAFVALALQLLEPGGELVAITPRSFCNGPYFRPFRELLFAQAKLLRVHVFETRDRAFADDDVLQENVVYHVKKHTRVPSAAGRTHVTLSSSAGPDAPIKRRSVPYAAVVDPADPESVVHLALSVQDAEIARRMRGLPCTLAELGLDVSTGRVVDFRAREHLRAAPGARTAPLVYPAHFEQGFVAWPRTGGRKPNAIVDAAATRDLLVPNDVYVLTKRFSSKEERRRIVAVVHDPARLAASIERVGFENHLNYFHARGRGLPRKLALGLAAYLNSTLVDAYFRQFNGHTQVNVADLKSLRYPTREVLEAIGRTAVRAFGDQARIDALVVGELAQLSKLADR